MAKSNITFGRMIPRRPAAGGQSCEFFLDGAAIGTMSAEMDETVKRPKVKGYRIVFFGNPDASKFFKVRAGKGADRAMYKARKYVRSGQFG